MLGVEDLSISFGGLDALSGLGFGVAEREIFALIGPNGAGKSTVFNVITVTHAAADAIVAAGVGHVPEGREIFRVIRRINDGGVAVLLVEQNARRALALASRGYVLEMGRLVASGPSAGLAEDPRVRTAYLGLDGRTP